MNRTERLEEQLIEEVLEPVKTWVETISALKYLKNTAI